MKTTSKEVIVKKTVYKPDVRSIEDFFSDITFDTAEECRAYEEKWDSRLERESYDWSKEALKDGRVLQDGFVIGSDIEYLELAFIRDKRDFALWVTDLRTADNYVDDWTVRNTLANYDLPIALAATYNEGGEVYFIEATRLYSDLQDKTRVVGNFIGENDPAYQRIKCKSRDIYMVRDIEQLDYRVFEKFEDARGYMADWLDGTIEKWEVERIRGFGSWDEMDSDYTTGDFLIGIGDRTGCYMDIVTYQS